ncbi:hypothetical protein KFU94_11255 [Chloroflexi bacterium TSY]|nr:hypothetical protein [Chloroflexi bacterium TSY]
MKTQIATISLILTLIILSGCAISDDMLLQANDPKTLDEVKEYAMGEWESISIELRPTEDRTGSGVILPTYLTRNFTYLEDDRFIGIITMYGDNYGELPLMEFEFIGELVWGNVHPIADGAWEIDYVLNEGFGVTPLSEPAAEMLNQVPVEGLEPFEIGVKQDILQKAFPLFNLAEGDIAVDYDLIYFKDGMLFMGAKHVDGTPFDRPERRPHQLQIPLMRVQ